MRNADLDRLRISKPIQSLVQTPKCLIATMTKQYVRLVSTLKKGKQVFNEQMEPGHDDALERNYG